MKTVVKLPMKRLILHIGMHKTGTSSIQSTLWNSRAQLENYDVYYPTIQEFNHSFSFYPMFIDDHTDHVFKRVKIYEPEDMKREQEKWRQLWVKEFQLSNHKNFIISGENLSLLGKDDIRKLKEFVDPFFDEIRIIIYVREPISYMHSDLQQHVKSGICSIEEFNKGKLEC